MSKDDVSLRPVIASDLPIFFEHQRDPESTRMAAFPPRERDAFMVHWAKVLENPDGVVRTILCDGEPAGNVLCWLSEGERLIGYWLGREYWGRGIATRALAQFLLEVPERPLFAHVSKHNIGSWRVLEKCGFRIVQERAGPSHIAGETVPEFVMILESDTGAQP